MVGSVVLREVVVTSGREAVKVMDCGLSLKSVADRAAGRASGAEPDIGSVELRPLLVVLRRPCLPSSLDWTSRCAA